MSYDRFFADNFAEFLRENFPTQTEARAAVWADKSPRQVANYLAGLCRPSGDLVAKAFTDPETAESAHRHLGRKNHNNDAHRSDRRLGDRGGTYSTNRRRLSWG